MIVKTGVPEHIVSLITNRMCEHNNNNVVRIDKKYNLLNFTSK